MPTPHPLSGVPPTADGAAPPSVQRRTGSFTAEDLDGLWSDDVRDAQTRPEPPVTLLVVLGPARDRASLGRHDGLPLSVDDPGGVVTGLGRWTMTADEGNDLLSQ